VDYSVDRELAGSELDWIGSQRIVGNGSVSRWRALMSRLLQGVWCGTGTLKHLYQ